MLVGITPTVPECPWVGEGGVLVEIPPPVPGVPVGQRGGMLVRLLGKLLLNPINIPLRRFAFATRRCPPSKAMSST